MIACNGKYPGSFKIIRPINKNSFIDLCSNQYNLWPNVSNQNSNLQIKANEAHQKVVAPDWIVWERGV